MIYESFSDGTYRGGFTYDEVGTTQFGNPVANGIGRLTSSWEAWGGQGFSYDALGRTTVVRRVVEHAADFHYTYNLDASVKSLQYPSGRVVSYGYDTAGHALSATDSNGTRYVSNATYWPGGAEFQRFMPNIYFSTSLNKRLQVSALYSDNGSVSNYYLNKTYNYGAQNNGNILSIVNNKDTSRNQNFTYDALNRITAGWTDGNTGALSWGEYYSIDPWGNMEMSPMGGKAHGGNWQCAADASNRANCLGYDAAGNVTDNGTAHYTYDAGNMLKTVGPITYWYDNNGQRYIKWNNGVPVKSYFYGAGAEILAEGSGGPTLTAEYIFFNGKRLARVDLPGSTVHYYLSDHLNSTSMVVSSTGVPEEESDFSPYGTEYVVSGPGSNRYKFTGKERDSESSLDYFGARYYSNGLGRFVTPDEPLLDQESADPQSWNLYTYAANNPLLYTDLDGHSHIDPNGYTVGDKNGECNSNGDCWSERNQDWEKPQPPPPPNDPVFEIVFHSPQAQRTWGLSARVTDKYIATPLLTFLSFAVPGALTSTLPDASLGLGVAVVSGTSKAAAKAAVEKMTISQAQKQALKREIARATTKESVSVERLADGSVRVLRSRPGADGYQVFSKIVDGAGNTRSAQTAVNASGEIVHYDPKN